LNAKTATKRDWDNDDNAAQDSKYFRRRSLWFIF